MGHFKDPKWGNRSQVQGSGVQGCIRAPGLHLECPFTRKGSASSGLIQNLELNWQLFRGKSIFDKDLGSLMPSLSLTLLYLNLLIKH